MRLAPLRRFANLALRPLGIEVARCGATPSMEGALAQLKSCGLSPRTVFDIGGAYGTPDLYRTFPNARYHLVDPLRESLPYMGRIAQHLNATIHNVALGSEDGVLDIDVRKDLGGSTLLKDVGNAKSIGSYQVPVKRFDQIFGDFETPALCKIDVQGAELMVLKGMGAMLDRIDALIVEVSLILTLAGGAEVGEILDHMRSHGFVLYDVGGLGRRPLDNALTQMDLVLVKRDSGVRADRRWSR